MELEIISYELCKLSLADVYLKRYLRSYVAASFIIGAFELLIDGLEATGAKIDLNHVAEYHRIIQSVLSKLFGYDKYVMF